MAWNFRRSWEWVATGWLGYCAAFLPHRRRRAAVAADAPPPVPPGPRLARLRDRLFLTKVLRLKEQLAGWPSWRSPGPKRSQSPGPFRPQLMPLEDRLAPGDALSPTSIALTAMGAGGGLFVQGLVRELVGGPNLVGSESISLTEPGARGDIGWAAPAPDNASVPDKFLPPVQTGNNQSTSPQSTGPLTPNQQAIGSYFATQVNPLAITLGNTLTSPLDDSAPVHPQSGGGGGHKIDDGSGNGGGGRNGSDAPAVNAEGSAIPVRGATGGTGSNYLTNSALASALASSSGAPASNRATIGPQGLALAKGHLDAHDPHQSKPDPASPVLPFGTDGGTLQAMGSAAVAGKSPFAFVANQGQAVPADKFIGQGGGVDFGLTATGANFSVAQSTASTIRTATADPVQMAFVGANSAAEPVGLSPLSAAQASKLPAYDLPPSGKPQAFSRVEYANLYPGVNLDFYGSPQDQLEYDWTVGAGASPSQVQFQFAGAQRLALDKQGDLQIFTAHDELIEHAPILYQMDQGVYQPVSGKYVLNGSQVGFAVGKYNPALPLVIDPTMNSLSGTGTSFAVATSAPFFKPVADISDSANTTFTFSVNWGDGTAPDSNAKTEPDGLGGFNVLDSHKYGAAGVYQVTVTVQDNLGNTIQVASTAIADNVFNTYPLGTTPNEIYVERLYHLLLNREADSGGLYWVNLLNSGTSPITVVQDIEQTSEYLNDLVNGLYLHYLRRSPDSGAQTWVSQLSGGSSIEYVTSEILGTPEYFNDQGGTNTGFAEGLYQDVLGRTGSAADVQNWVNQLNSGVSRQQVAYDFLTSTEYGDDLVNGGAFAPYYPNWGGYYPEFLHRQADSADLNHWVQAIQNTSDQAVLAGILGSAEGQGLQSDAALTGTPTSLALIPNVAFSGTVARFSDGDPTSSASSFSATIDWGDGQVSAGTVSGSSGNFTVGGAHTYTAVGTYPVWVTINDPAASTVQVPTTATVASSLSGTATTFSATEGAAFAGQVLADFSDTDPKATFTATVNWGDGTALDQAPTIVSDGKGGFNVVDGHTYTEEGTYPVTVSIRDNDGSSILFQSTAKVADAALTIVSLTPPSRVVEGQPFTNLTVAHFSDADPAGTTGDYTAVVSLGDGNQVTLTGTASSNGQIVTDAGGGFDVQLSYTYEKVLTNATFAVTVYDTGDGRTVSDSTDSAANASAANFTTTDAPLTVVAFTPPGAVEGKPFTNQTILYFTDADPAGALGYYTALVSPGDGSQVQLTGTPGANGQIMTDPVGGFDVQFAHTYTEELSHATFSVEVIDHSGGRTLNDPSDSTITATTDTFDVADGPLNPTGGFTVNGVEGADSGMQTVATFTDANPGNHSADLTAAVNWGGAGTGSSSGSISYNSSSGVYTVQGSFAYAEEGTYTIGVTFSDDGGSTAQTTSTAAVADAALTAGPLMPPTAVEGQALSNVTVFHFSDADPAGTLGDYTAMVTLGDGKQVTLTGTPSSNGQVVANAGGGFDVQLSYSYAEELANATFAVKVYDNGSTAGATTNTFSVADAPLTATGSYTVHAVEGANTGMQTVATFTDANPGNHSADLTATINWGGAGTGSTSGTISYNATTGVYTVQGSYVYADEGNDTITVTIIDVGGSTATAGSSALVQDAALTAAPTTFIIGPNAALSRTVANFTDANSSAQTTDFLATINWGDNTSSSGTVTANGGSFAVAGSHAYAQVGTYPVTVTITDDGGSSAQVQSTATVAQTLSAAPGTRFSTNEGSLFGATLADFKESDPNATFSVSVSWGDGSADTPTPGPDGQGGFNVSDTHAYAEAGAYTIMVLVSDSDGNSIEVLDPIQVADVPLTGTAQTILVAPSRPFTRTVATFTDANPIAQAGDFTATIAWGDGSTTPGSITSINGSFTVSGSHAYAAVGTYPITVSIHDVGGSSTTVDSTADVAVLLTGQGTSVAATEGAAFIGTVATFTDIDPYAGRIAVSVNWGDGSIDAGAMLEANGHGGYTVVDTHVYGEEGTYPVTVNVSDSDSNFTSIQSTAHVVSFSQAMHLSGIEGSPLSGAVASFTDPFSTASNFTASINWGGAGSGSPAGTISYNSGTGVYTVQGSYSYAEEGTYPVTVNIQDSDGNSIRVTSTASVADAALAASAIAISPTGQQSFTGPVATFSDTDPNGTTTDYSATIAWGDGTGTSGSIAPNNSGGFNVVGTHTYAAVNKYTFTVTIKDAGGSTASVQGTATVAMAGHGTPFSTTEGTLYSGTIADFSDLDPNATFTTTVDWGDRTTPDSNTTLVSDGKGGFFVQDQHPYAEDGMYTATITVQDSDGHSIQLQSTATVKDAALTASAGNIYSTEGSVYTGPVASFTDANTGAAASDFTALITWGDGKQSAGTVSGSNGNFTVDGSHTYGEEGKYPVSVQITDDGGRKTTATASATVADASLTGTAATFKAFEGAKFQGTVASFSDAYTSAPASDYTVTINWGDGSAPDTTATLQAQGNGAFTVLGSHIYAEEGTHVATVTIKDKGGSTALVYTIATLADAALTASAANINSPEGSAFNGTVATFNDADPNGSAGDYTATITWGDGTTSPGTISGTGPFTVSGDHTYADEGSFPISVQIKDAGGAQTTASATVSVAEGDTMSASSTDLVLNQDVAYRGPVAIFTDSTYPTAPAGDFIATIVWGDGQQSAGTITAIGGGQFQVYGDHTYTQTGSFTLQVTVRDDGAGTAQASTQSTVSVGAGVRLATGGTDGAGGAGGLDLNGTEQTPLSAPVATFYDVADPTAPAGSFTVEIDWGDGNFSAGTVTGSNGFYTVSGSHTYADEGQYDVTTVIADRTGDSATATGLAVIADAALSNLTVASPSFLEGVAHTNVQVATFTDANAQAAAADFKALITWGDGAESVGTVTDGNGSFTVSGSHTYTDVGSDTLTVQVFDIGGSQVSSQNTVTVGENNKLQVTPIPVEAYANEQFSGAVATFTDPGWPTAPAYHFYATIDWGDGIGYQDTTTATVSANGDLSFSVVDQHTYTKAGSYPITVTIQADSSSGATLATVPTTATVAPLRLQIDAGAYEEFTSGGSTAPVVTFGDPNPGASAGDYTAVINWGDGTTATASGSDIVQNSDGSFSVLSTHLYPDEMAGTFSVQISGTDGLALYGSQKFGVADAPFQSQTYTSYCQNCFADTNPQSDPSDFTAIIEWIPTIGSSSTTFTAGTVTRTSGGGYVVTGDPPYDGAIESHDILFDRGETIPDGGPNYLPDYVFVGEPPPLATNTSQMSQAYLTPIGEAQADLNQGGLQLSQPLDFAQSDNGRSLDPVSLVYNSTTGGPLGDAQPKLEASVNSFVDFGEPVQVQATWTIDGVAQPAQVFDSLANNPTYQPPAPLTPGPHQWTLHVQITADFGAGGTITRDLQTSGQVYVAARAGSPFGAGWWLSNLDQLFPDQTTGDVSWMTGNGDISTFTKNNAYTNTADYTFTSPAGNFGRLVQNGDGSYTYTGTDGMVWRFSSQGLLLSKTDRDGLTETFAYEPNTNLLSRFTEFDGGVTAFSYGSSGLLQSITEPGGRTLNFAESGSGDLTQITDAAGNVRTIGYNGPLPHLATSDDWAPWQSSFSYKTYTDSSGNIHAALVGVNLGQGEDYTIDPKPLMTSGSLYSATVTDGLKLTTDYDLDSMGKLTELVRPDGSAEDFQRDNNELVTESYDFDGNRTTYQYDDAGDLIETDYADGTSEFSSYDPKFHQLTQFTDRAGNTTNYLINQYGDTVQTIDPMGNVSKSVYNNGLLTKTIDATGAITQYDYDAARQMVEMVGPYFPTDTQIEVTSYTPDAAGFTTATTDPMGNTVQDSYDGNGNVIKTIDGDGNVQTMQYDAYGDVTAAKDGAGNTTQSFYDTTGALVESIDGNNNPSYFQHDAGGNEIETIDAAKHDSKTFYDKDGRPIETIDGAGHTAFTSYDPNGNVTETIDGNGKATFFQYDTNSQLTQTTDPLGHVTKTAYNADGDVTATVDPLGNTTSTLYNADNEAIATMSPALDPGGAPQILQTLYNKAGQVDGSIDGRNDGESDTLNAQGEVTQSTDADRHVTINTYNADNQLTNRSVYNNEADYQSGAPPVSTVSYSYDGNGNVSQTTDGDGHKTLYTYDGDGNIKTMTDGDGNVTVYNYDGNSNVLNETVYGNKTDAANQVNPVRKTVYAYDGDGNVTGTQVFSSDGSLASGTGDSYNGDGTVATSTDGDQHVTVYQYDGDGQLLSTALYNNATDAANQVNAVAISRETYNADGTVASRTDADGNMTQYSYDANGNVTSTTLTDSQNHFVSSTSATYDDAGNVLTSTDADGNVTTNTYDESGDLVSSETRDPAGNLISYEDDIHDGAGNVFASEDGAGNRTVFKYDGDNQVQSSTTLDDAGKPVTSDSKTYDEAGNLLTSTDGDGNVTTYGYDGANNVISETVKDGATVASKLISQENYSYDADGNVLTKKDTYGNTTAYQYDGNGNETSKVVTDPNGAVVSSLTRQYDGNGNAIVSTDGDGNITKYQYDANGNVIGTQLIDRFNNPIARTSALYDPNGNLLTSTDADGNVTTYEYDGNGNVIVAVVKDKGGTIISQDTYTNDGNGNVLTSTDAYGNQTVNSWDGDHLLRQVILSAGKTVSYRGDSFDAEGQQTYATGGDGTVTETVYSGAEAVDTIVTDNRGKVVGSEAETFDLASNVRTSTNGVGDVTFNTYDGNELIATTAGYGSSSPATTLYSYDLNGNVATLTDPDGNKTKYSYDANNNVLASTNSLGQTTTYQYDGNGNIRSKTDALGRRISYAYDANRLVGETWYAADGQTVVATQSYTYDPAGNMSTASNAAGSYTMSYDGNRLITRTDPNALTLTYGYDQNGNVSSIADSQGGVTKMAYDGAGNITSKTYQDSATQLRVDFTHDLAGNVLTETPYTDMAGTQLAGSTQYGYDAGQVTSIVQKDAAGSLLASYQYTYDKAGRVVLENDNGNITKYLYDAKGQLVQANGQKYKWDPNGNPTGPGYAIGPNNELLSDGTYNYSYDAVGNQTGKTNIASGVNWSYSYDNANYLVSAVESGANGKIIQSVSYNYDAFGNRISETVTARKKTTNDQMSYDASGNLYADLANGSVATRYLSGITGPDTWLARVTSGVGAAWLLTDHLGSVRTVVDLSGKILDQIDYDPFGAITSETHPAQGGRLKFDGGQEDQPTGQLYFVDRNYDLTTRRWTTPDPTGFTFDLNPYRFVDNAPTDYTDPSGLRKSGLVVVKGSEKAWVEDLAGIGISATPYDLPPRWFGAQRSFIRINWNVGETERNIYQLPTTKAGGPAWAIPFFQSIAEGPLNPRGGGTPERKPWLQGNANLSIQWTTLSSGEEETITRIANAGLKWANGAPYYVGNAAPTNPLSRALLNMELVGDARVRELHEADAARAARNEGLRKAGASDLYIAGLDTFLPGGHFDTVVGSFGGFAGVPGNGGQSRMPRLSRSRKVPSKPLILGPNGQPLNGPPKPAGPILLPNGKPLNAPAPVPKPILGANGKPIAGPSVFGKVTPPPGLVPGTVTFGNAIHERIAKLLEEKYPGVRFRFEVKPGQTGPDVEVLPGAKNPGFNFADIKPRNTEQQKKLDSQVQNWRQKGVIGPKDVVKPFTYDADGTVYEGF